MTIVPKPYRLRKCFIEKCPQLVFSRDLCFHHYYHLMKDGHPLSVRERFIEANPPANGVGLIPLSRGLYAIVDEDRYSELLTFTWTANAAGYAYRVVESNGVKSQIFMHNHILCPPEGLWADHINRIPYDNRMANLRSVTHSENLQNREYLGKKTSKYRGVSWFKRLAKWTARINYQGESLYLGVFESEQEAARAYDRKAKDLYGPSAYVNFRGDDRSQLLPMPIAAS